VAACLEGSILSDLGDQLLQGQADFRWLTTTQLGSSLGQTVSLAAWQPPAYLVLCRAEVPVILGVGLLHVQGNQVEA
jgi:hypothetical protein